MATGGEIRAGRAYVEVTSKDAGLAAGLAKAAERVQRFGVAVRSAGLGMLALGGAVSAPLATAATTFANTGEELLRMSQRTKISVESLSELGYAARQTGGDLDAIGISVLKMDKFVAQAAAGSAKATAVLDQLGLTVADLNGLTQEQRFGLLADRLAAVPDPALQGAAAMKVFGAGVKQLLPLLSMGGKGIEQLRGQARDLGLQWSTVDAQAAARYAESMRDLWEVLGRATEVIGSAVVPSIAESTRQLTTAAVAATRWVGQHKALVATASTVAAAVVAAGVGVVVLGTVIESTAVIAGVAAAAMSTMGSAAASAAGIVGGVLAPALGLVEVVAGSVAAVTSGAFGVLTTAAAIAFGLLSASATGAASATAGVLLSTFGLVAAAAQGIAVAAGTVVLGAITAAASAAATVILAEVAAIPQLVAAASGGISAVIMAALGVAATAIGTLIPASVVAAGGLVVATIGTVSAAAAAIPSVAAAIGATVVTVFAAAAAAVSGAIAALPAVFAATMAAVVTAVATAYTALTFLGAAAMLVPGLVATAWGIVTAAVSAASAATVAAVSAAAAVIGSALLAIPGALVGAVLAIPAAITAAVTVSTAAIVAAAAASTAAVTAAAAAIAGALTSAAGVVAAAWATAWAIVTAPAFLVGAAIAAVAAVAVAAIAVVVVKSGLLARALAAVASSIGRVFGRVASSVGAAFSAAGAAIATPFLSAWAAARRVGSAVVSAAAGMVAGVRAALQSAAGSAAAAFASVRAHATEAWTGAAEAARQAIPAIRTTLTRLAGDVADGFGRVRDVAAAVWVGLEADAVAAFAGVRDALSAGDYETAARIIGTVIKLEIAKAIRDVWDPLLPTFYRVRADLLNGWADLAAAFRTIWSYAKQYLGDWGEIRSAAGRAMAYLVDAWATLSSAIRTAWSYVREYLGDWSAVRRSMAALWEYIRAGFVNVMVKVGALIADVLSNPFTFSVKVAAGELAPTLPEAAPPANTTGDEERKQIAEDRKRQADAFKAELAKRDADAPPATSDGDAERKRIAEDRDRAKQANNADRDRAIAEAAKGDPQTDARIKELTEQLNALGKTAANEAQAVTDKRASLQAQLDAAQAKVGQAGDLSGASGSGSADKGGGELLKAGSFLNQGLAGEIFGNGGGDSTQQRIARATERTADNTAAGPTTSGSTDKAAASPQPVSPAPAPGDTAHNGRADQHGLELKARDAYRQYQADAAVARAGGSLDQVRASKAAWERATRELNEVRRSQTPAANGQAQPPLHGTPLPQGEVSPDSIQQRNRDSPFDQANHNLDEAAAAGKRLRREFDASYEALDRSRAADEHDGTPDSERTTRAHARFVAAQDALRQHDAQVPPGQLPPEYRVPEDSIERWKRHHPDESVANDFGTAQARPPSPADLPGTSPESGLASVFRNAMATMPPPESPFQPDGAGLAAGLRSAVEGVFGGATVAAGNVARAVGGVGPFDPNTGRMVALLQQLVEGVKSGGLGDRAGARFR